MNDIHKKPIKLVSKNIKKPWGALPGNIGEKFEAFLFPDEENASNKIHGEKKYIGCLIKEMPEKIIGKDIYKIFGPTLPYYLKTIYAKESLSIQVHPDNSLAKELENQPFGKTEAWYILDTIKPDAGLYLGLKSGVTKELFDKKLRANTDITELLNFVPVKKGDFFYIPAGMLHAIGGGVIILEPQQNSNTTYRVYDYGSKRELHVDKAMRSINFESEFNIKYSQALKQKKKLTNTQNVTKTILLESKFFNAEIISINSTDKKTSTSLSQNYELLYVTEGDLFFNNIEFKAGESVFLPASITELNIGGTGSFFRVYYAPADPPKEE